MRSALGIAALLAALLLNPAAAWAQGSPPDWTRGPASFSGTDLLPAPSASTPATASSAAAAAAAVAASASPLSDDRTRMLEARVDELDARTRGADVPLQVFRNLRVSGYLQPQLVAQFFNAAASPNQQSTGALPLGVDANTPIPLADGTTTNSLGFRLRRARIQFVYTPTDYARIGLEIEPFVPPDVPRDAPFPGLFRTTEVTGIARLGGSARLEFTAGVFRVPFGGELVQSSADRRFIERSWGAQNMFPGAFDMGARARLVAFDERLDVTLAVLNGHTLGERTFARVPDLNRAKDVVLRATWDFGPLQVGANGYVGTGQIVDALNLRLKGYTRMAVNVELGVRHPLFGKKVGNTLAKAEFVAGQNMDRGVLYPTLAPQIGAAGIAAEVQSRRQLSVWARVEQDLGEWVTLGVRADHYTPDTRTGGSRLTLGGSATVHFTKGLLLLTEVSHAWDNVALVGPDLRAVATVSAALQGRF